MDYVVFFHKDKNNLDEVDFHSFDSLFKTFHFIREQKKLFPNSKSNFTSFRRTLNKEFDDELEKEKPKTKKIKLESTSTSSQNDKNQGDSSDESTQPYP